ncbi:MAG: peptidylprolyl isomerase [Candidatus Aenigmatarchaeota archaeon]
MKKGDFIRINYIGRLDSGEIFDLTDAEIAKKENVYNPNIKYGPIPIIVGEGFLLKGLDDALFDMDVGEKKKIEIKPEYGFGQRKPELIKILPKKIFKSQNIEPKPGMVIDFSGTKGRIQSINAGRVRVDFNNPLAGKTLHYEIEIKEKIEDVTEKIKSIFEFFGIDNAKIKVDEDNVTIDMIKLPQELKNKISSLILNNINEIKRVTFLETFERK